MIKQFIFAIVAIAVLSFSLALLQNNHGVAERINALERSYLGG
jgi:hypothetical protein